MGIDTRRTTRLDEGAAKWDSASHISAERWEQLQKEREGVLKLRRVVELTGKSRSAIYRDARAGRFPMWVITGPNSTAWRAADVFAWIESRPYACEAA